MRGDDIEQLHVGLRVIRQAMFRFQPAPRRRHLLESYRALYYGYVSELASRQLTKSFELAAELGIKGV